MNVITPEANVVEDPVKIIQIPPNLRPGDSFIVHPDHGSPFTVIVPEGAVSGAYIKVIVPTDATVVHEAGGDGKKSDKIEVDKATAGAALAAGVVGLVVFGTIGGVVMAGGAAYVAATQPNSKVGKAVRNVGQTTYSSANKAKNWVGKQIKKL